MALQFLTVARVLLLGAGTSLLAMAYWVHSTEDGTATRSFALLLAVVGTMAIGDGVAAPDPTTLAYVWALAYLLIPVAFAVFVVEYYGLPYLVTRGQRVAFLVPVVVGLAGSTFIVFSPSMAASSVMSGGTTTGTAGYAGVVTDVAGLADSIGIFYAGGVMFAAAGVLLQTCRRYEHLDTTLGIALAFVAFWPWFAYLTTPATFGMFSLPTVLGGTAGGYVLSALVAGFVVSTGRLFEASPAAGTLGPETVLSDLADPVVVVDREGQVVRLNDRAAETFETTADDSVGEPFESVLGVGIDEVEARDCIELTNGGRTRYFEGTVADVEDRHGRAPGRAVVVRDVTQRRLRGQRLSVLNRVLRHNLRNEMTNIIGRVELLADGNTDDGIADTILTTADDLVMLSERAREVEEMMSVEQGPNAETDVESVVGSVVQAVGAEFPGVAIRTDVDVGLTLPADERILTPVLRNLVENAAQYNDAETPTVDVEATVDRDRPGIVRLTVADNGPGIPDSERTVIGDGEESPLEHGSGLGLWAAYWGVTRLGGDLHFEDNDPRGTRVVLRIPRQADETASGGLAASTVGAD